MSPQLDAIWQQIQRLDEAERIALGLRLHEHTEVQSPAKSDANGKQPNAGWRAVYGAADPSEVAELQQIIEAQVAGHNSHGSDQLSMQERAERFALVCRDAAALEASRRAAGLPEPQSAPWPSSTCKFMAEQTQHARSVR